MAPVPRTARVQIRARSATPAIVTKLGRRWFTSGPSGGLRRWGGYWRIEAQGPEGAHRRGWARVRAGWPLAPGERCALCWDESGERGGWEGLPTWGAIPLLLVLVGAMLALWLWMGLRVR